MSSFAVRSGPGADQERRTGNQGRPVGAQNPAENGTGGGGRGSRSCRSSRGGRRLRATIRPGDVSAGSGSGRPQFGEVVPLAAAGRRMLLGSQV